MRPVLKADNLPPPCAVVMKSGNLNFLEPSGPLQACNGTALPFFFNCVQAQVQTAQVAIRIPVAQLDVRSIQVFHTTAQAGGSKLISLYSLNQKSRSDA